MDRRHRQRTFWYGNFRSQDPDSLILGWETYDARPRFGTNWMGIRGRLGILSEGYSNADFKTRILATYNFVHEVLSLVAEQRTTIKSLVLASDAQRPESIAVRSTLGPPTQEVVVAEITSRRVRATVAMPGDSEPASIVLFECRSSAAFGPAERGHAPRVCVASTISEYRRAPSGTKYRCRLRGG